MSPGRGVFEPCLHVVGAVAAGLESVDLDALVLAETGSQSYFSVRLLIVAFSLELLRIKVELPFGMFQKSATTGTVSAPDGDMSGFSGSGGPE